MLQKVILFGIIFLEVIDVKKILNNNKISAEKNRIFAIDTIKTLLIFLVVFGHLLELNLNGKFKYIYCVIYIFHMAAFVFCSGYLFRFDKKKFITKNYSMVEKA